MFNIRKLIAVTVCCLLLLSCVSPTLALNGRDGQTTLDQYVNNPDTKQGVLCGRCADRDTHIQSTPGPVYVQLKLTPTRDPCFERFAGALPPDYKVLDSIKTSGPCTLANTAAYAQYDAATDITVAFVGSSTKPIPLTVSTIDDATWNFDSPSTFDYAVVSMPLPPAALTDGPIHIIRLEDSGEVYDLPYLIDSDANRLYFATSDFCIIVIPLVIGAIELTTADIAILGGLGAIGAVAATSGGGQGTAEDPYKIPLEFITQHFGELGGLINHYTHGAGGILVGATNAVNQMVFSGQGDCKHHGDRKDISLPRDGHKPSSAAEHNFYCALSGGGPVPGKDDRAKWNRKNDRDSQLEERNEPDGGKWCSRTKYNSKTGQVEEIDYYDGDGKLVGRVEYVHGRPDHFHILDQPGNPATWQDAVHYNLPKYIFR
jgi:hypothetical protein